MRIAHNATEMRQTLAPLRRNRSVAFVPTMGCLHEGHMQLINKARTLADVVVVSIYVNPLQFGPNEDFDAYPRDFDRDARMCETAGVDFIFHPARLYPDDGPKLTLKVDKDLAGRLCGAVRPGHFDGVATVVNLLFNLVQPDFAVFGEKDWQQLVIIRRMVSDLQMPVRVVGVPTVREKDGLAMSSRNRYLAPAERARATALVEALRQMQRLAADGISDCQSLRARGLERLREAGVEAEYLEICDAADLHPLAQLPARGHARAFVAARIGNARLIDNMPLAGMEAGK